MTKIRAKMATRSSDRLLWLFKDDLIFVANSLNKDGTDDVSMKFPCNWELTLWIASMTLDVVCPLVGLLWSCDPSEDSPVFASLSKFIFPFWTTAAMGTFSASEKVNYKS